MSSKQTKSASSSGSSSKLSKESQKKQQQQQLQEKPLTARKPSVDKPRSGTSSLPSSPLSSPKTSVAVSSSSSSRRAASPLTRSGTASLPSSPLLNNPKASASAKKTASPNLAKKEAAKLNEKKVAAVDKGSGRSSAGGCGVERATGDLNVGGAAAGAVDNERSSPLPKVVSPIRSNRPRGAESGTFTRRQPPPPVEVEVKVDRPVVSPRSRKIQESSSHFLEVKKREIGVQKEMENFVSDQLQKVQVNLRQVDEISSKIGRCHDQINVETDQLSHLIGRSLALIRDLDGTLATVRDRVTEFIDRAENGALELDAALKTVVTNLCNYSAETNGSGVHSGGPDGDSGKSGKPPGGSATDSHSKVDEPGDNSKSGEDTQNGNLVGGNQKSGDAAVDRPPVNEKLEDCSRDHSIAGDYVQSEKIGDESGDQVQTFKSDELEDLENGYLTEELIQNDALGVGLDAKGPVCNLGNGKPGGENGYYTQISKPLHGYAGHSQRSNESLAKSTEKFVTKPNICGNAGQFDLEVLAVIQNLFEDPSNIPIEDVRHCADVIWSAFADTPLQKQVARGTFTKDMVEELLMIIVVYLSQKQSEFEDVSGLEGVEKLSLDGLESMNALTSLLSPIKSNASNVISDCASKTDAVVCNETNEEHLSEGKSIVYLSQKPSEDVDVSGLGGVEKASCTLSPNSDVRKSLDGLEILNALISLLSFIKSNASNAISDNATKTDAVVCNEEHLSEGKSIVQKASCTLSPKSDVGKSLDGLEIMNGLISLLSPIKSNASNAISDYATKTDAVVCNETPEEHLSEGKSIVEKASCTLSTKSGARKSLDGLEIMNALISLLSPIKSNASNAISDYSTKTDAEVCNGTTEDHLSEGKAHIEGSEKVEPREIEEQVLKTKGPSEIIEEQRLETEGPSEIIEEQRLETEGPEEIIEKQRLETEGPAEIIEKQGLETEGPAEMKEEQVLETKGPAEMKEEQVLETKGPAEMKEVQVLETKGPAEMKEEQVLETKGPAEMKEEQVLETKGPAEMKEEQGLETEGPTESMDTSEEEETTSDKDRL